MPGPLIVISGPSGVGKTTVVRALLSDTVLPLWQSVSVTTRGQRSNEQAGRDYFFWDEARFEAAIAAGKFLEFARVHGRHYYGTPAEEVERHRASGEGVILVIDVQGFEQVRARCPDAFGIFLYAPLEVLEKRIRERGGDDESSVQQRLATARCELARAREYNVQLLNDELNDTVYRLRSVIAERFRSQSDGGQHA